MGNYQQHIFLGFITTTMFLVLLQTTLKIDVFNAYTLYIAIIATLIFSILPDIDHKNSRASNLTLIGVAIVIFAILFSLIKISLKNILPIILLLGIGVYHIFFAKNGKDHRQFPHTFIFGFAISFLFLIITQSFIGFYVAILSFSSHLLLDFRGGAFKRDIAMWKKIFAVSKSVRKEKINKGFCIRCKEVIKFDVKKPYCKRCFAIWDSYGDTFYKEKYCHECGLHNFSTMRKPRCIKCFGNYFNKI